MNKILRRVVSVAAALAVMFTAAFVFDVPKTVARAAVVASGFCGATSLNNLKWSLDSNGKFTVELNRSISNNDGLMKNYQNNQEWTRSPWDIDYRNSITSVEIKDGVKSVGEQAFLNFNNLTEVSLPNSLTAIGDNAFAGTAITGKLIIPASVTSIGTNAFDECKNLTSVDIQAKITKINNFVFKNSSSLKEVTIPETVTEIGNKSFGGCEALTTLVVKCTTPPKLYGLDSFYQCDNVAKIYVPCASMNDYKNKWLYDFMNKYRPNHPANKIIHYSKVEPTCAKKGRIEYWHCNSCGKNYSNSGCTTAVSDTTIKMVAHTTGDWQYDSNSHWKVCSVCGSTITRRQHDTDDKIVHKDATCTEDGVVGGKYCSTCLYGKEEAEAIIPKLGHTYGSDWEKDINQHWQICSVCSAESEKAPHNWDSGKITTRPTCTATGVKTYTCTACNATKTETVAATGHNYGKTWSTSTTQHWHNCTVCNAEGTKSNHTWGEGIVTKEPTYNDTGIRTYTCVCGKTRTETIPKTTCTHNWGEGIITKEPGCTEKGVKTFTCSTCGSTKTEEVAAKGHTLVTDTAVEPTCTNTGLTEGSHCSVCNKVLVEQKPVNANGHTWGEWTVTKAATESAVGEQTRTCSVCKATETQEIPVLAHTHSLSKVERVEATCTTAGNIEYWTCSGCGQKFSDDSGETLIGDSDVTIAATNHDWDKWSITEDPTTETEGTAERVCKNNGNHKETVKLAVLTDTSVWTKDDTQHIDPTKESEGKDVYKNDEYGEVVVIIDKLKDNTSSDNTSSETSSDSTSSGTSSGNTSNNDNGTTHEPESPAGNSGNTSNSLTSENASSNLTPESTSNSSTSENTSNSSTPENTSSSSTPENTTSSSTPEIMPDGTTSDSTSSSASSDKVIETSEETLQIDDGSVFKKTEVAENVPNTVFVTSLKELVETVLTEQEREEVKNGANIRIVLKVEDGEELAPAEDKQAVIEEIKKLDGFKHGQFLDVSLLKIINEASEKITQLDQPITVTFDVPENLRGSNRQFAVIRVHDGKTDVLNDSDNNPYTITIETDKFSTYAIAYKSAETSGNPYTGVISRGMVIFVIGGAVILVITTLILCKGKIGISEDEKNLTRHK